MKKGIGVILAAGLGTRVGGPTAKQFLRVNGNDIFMYVLKAYLSHPDISRVIIAVPESKIDYARKKISKVLAPHFAKEIDVIAGGHMRRTSIKRTLDHIDGMDLPDDRLIVFQDAVRPFVLQRHITAVMKSASRSGGAVLGVRPSDPVAIVYGKYIRGVPKRKELYHLVQSPECYVLRIIRKAHQMSRSVRDATNLELMRESRLPVAFVPHSDFNHKLTYRNELDAFATLLGIRK